jgi:hypothetical protein
VAGTLLAASYPASTPQRASFLRYETAIDVVGTPKSPAAKACTSPSGIHGAPRFASISPGSTSSGCTERRASAFREYSGPASSAMRSFSRTFPDRYSSAVSHLLVAGSW